MSPVAPLPDSKMGARAAEPKKTSKWSRKKKRRARPDEVAIRVRDLVAKTQASRSADQPRLTLKQVHFEAGIGVPVSLLYALDRVETKVWKPQNAKRLGKLIAGLAIYFGVKPEDIMEVPA